MQVKFKPSHSGWVMLWIGTTSSNLWGPNGRTTTSGTEYKNAINYVTANTNCTREFDIVKGQSIFVCYIPESTSVKATLTNLEATVTIAT